MGTVCKKKLQQFYNKAIQKAKKDGDKGRRTANKYFFFFLFNLLA
jgi:hypothetical protein